MADPSSLSIRKPAKPSVAVAILSWNGRHHLEECLPALRAQDDPGVPWQVLVLDNGSWDGTTEWLTAEHPEVKALRSDVNLGFCGGNRLLAESTEADALVLLNDDTRPRKDWLARLVAAWRDAPDDVAAISGALVDWRGERLDFARGIVTFDGHAFQDGFGMPLAGTELPAAGTELPFACGGNMIVDRETFLRVGAFDDEYFAYLEDVDLGWRLWSAGHRVLFEPEAVAHHRSMATSNLLGDANRGFLFERNAFLTAYKNLDDEMWPRLAPLIWMTLVHRVQTLMVQNNPGGELLTLDPYAGLIANTAAKASRPTSELVEDEEDGADTPAVDSESTSELDAPPDLAALAGSGVPRTTLRQKWQGYGKREFVRRGLRKALRLVLPGWVFDDGPATRLVDPRTYAHLRALTWIIAHLDEQATKRRAVQARRRRPDREILERFPLHVVATYPGDERLFRSAGFRDQIPADLPIRWRSLDEVIHED